MRPFRLANSTKPALVPAFLFFFLSPARFWARNTMSNSHCCCFWFAWKPRESETPANAHILYGRASRNSLLRTWSNQLERIIFAALCVQLSTGWPDWAWAWKKKRGLLKLQFTFEFIHIHTCKWAGKCCRRFKWPSYQSFEKRTGKL